MDLGPLPFTRLSPLFFLSLTGSCRIISACRCGCQPPARCQRSKSACGQRLKHRQPSGLSCCYPPSFLFPLLLPVAVGHVARLCSMSLDPSSPSVLTRSLCLGIVGSDDTYNYSLFHWRSTVISFGTKTLWRRLFLVVRAVGVHWPAWWWSWKESGVPRGKREWTWQQKQKLEQKIPEKFVHLYLVWQDICKSLWCHRTGHRCETKFMPAAEGTSCGLDMVRKGFLCLWMITAARHYVL